MIIKDVFYVQNWFCALPSAEREGRGIDKYDSNAFSFLRQEGFITERKAVGMKTKDGSIMVVFEWKTRESIGEAATNSVVQNIWMQVSKVSDFDEPGSIKEFHDMFPDFEALTIE